MIPLRWFWALVVLFTFAVACTASVDSPQTRGSGGTTGSGGTGGLPGSGGTSAGLCAAGQMACGVACVTVSTDVQNCGACGNVCPAGSACNAGVCSCQAGLAACTSGCTNVAADALNCGACGTACQTGQSCMAGSCACLNGLSACASGCVDPQSSAQNCGGCGVVCAPGQVCSNGACTTMCAQGQMLCGSDCPDLMVSVTNCGGCGVTCTAGKSCVAGACSCPQGQTPCGAACTDPETDSNNCGACSAVCSGGTSCSAGVCECTGGQTKCGNTCTNTQSDVANCGVCSNACQAGASCSNGTCTGGSGGMGGGGGNAGSAGGGNGGTGGNGGSSGSGGTGQTADCDYYVATTGNDSNAGTVSQPFRTVGRGQTAASAGDVVCIRGGTYSFSGSGTVGVVFNKPGQANNHIKYWAYPGEIPVFDLTNLTPSNRVTGLDVNTSYVHLRGLEVKGVHQYAAGEDSWGVRIRGSNNILENLNVHHNDAPGVFITSGADNLVLNCDSHHNWDFMEDGGSGDGFGCHSTGSGNVMRGCRAYDNSDDGYDFINAPGSCLVEKSFAFRNGYEPGTTTTAGNGAGFKAGGYGSPPAGSGASSPATHTVRQCVAFGNRSQGFYANHHNGRINFHNNTAFRNSANYNMLADSGYPSSHDIRNNIAMSPGTAITNFSTGGTATNNTWNGSVTVSADDFMSVDESLATAARLPDGSLPENNFMRLVAGSDLIDKGVNVGLPYNGSAPDMGAFER